MEILNQIPITEMAQNSQVALMVLVPIFIVAFIIFSVSDRYSLVCPISGCVTVVLLIACATVGLTAPMIETGRYKYEVTLEDTVPINEIYEKYKVIEKRGDIWVLEDKVAEGDKE